MNWIVRYYIGAKEIAHHTIKDRTEHEAEKEAVADMPIRADDWTLTLKGGK